MADKTWLSAIDLGTEQDPASFAVAEVSSTPKRYDVRHLQQWQLGVSPTVIINDLARMFKKPPLAGAPLIVDRTGIGVPILYSMREKCIGARIIPVHFHAGFQTSSKRGFVSVPKSDIMSALKLVLGESRLRISPKLPLADKAKRELENFIVNITEKMREEFGNADASTHDDLVTALALLSWYGEKHRLTVGLRTYHFTAKKKHEGRHIIVCGKADVEALDNDPDLPTLVVNISDAPGAPVLPTSNRLLTWHCMTFRDLDPQEVTGQWTDDLSSSMFTRAQATALWSWLNRPEFSAASGQGWMCLVIVDSGIGDRRGLSVAYALADVLRLPRTAVVQHGEQERDEDVLEEGEDEPPNRWVYSTVKQARSAVI